MTDLTEIHFLLPPKATLPVARCLDKGEDHHPLLHLTITWELGTCCFSLLPPLSLLCYTHLMRQRKMNKQESSTTILFWYKFNHASCSCDHPFTGLSNAISITAVPLSPGARDNWELMVAHFAGVKAGEEYFISVTLNLQLFTCSFNNKHQENT